MHRATIRRRERLTSGFAPQTATAAPPSALDITEIRAFPLREPVSGNRYVLLRVGTKSGLVGWGECPAAPPDDLAALTKAWLGRPANTYAAIDMSTTPLGGALDMALLDILGKACKAPIYRVLGGPTRAKVRAFSSPSQGDFPIVPISLPAPGSRNQGKAYQNHLLELASHVPASADFVVLGDGLLTPGDAASVAATLEKIHPLWFDEPCAHSNIEAVRKISGETVVPLGFGRGIRDAAVFQALLRDGLIDVARPEIGHFGITGSRRVAAIAEPYYVAVAPHHDGGPVGTAAAIQLAASIPNFFLQHVPAPAAAEDKAMRAAIVSPSIEVGKAGFLGLTQAPGLGVTVNESALEKYRAA